MKNIAYHILDIVHNSIQAEAELIQIIIEENTEEHSLTLKIIDDGRGMTSEQVKTASDPYFTSRKTRKVGMGLALLKQNAQQAGGRFLVNSELKKGTVVEAVFDTSNIDCPALGDIVGTIHSLITTTQNVNFVFLFKKNENEFELDTREVKKILEGVPFYQKEISQHLKEMIEENLKEIGVALTQYSYTA